MMNLLKEPGEWAIFPGVLKLGAGKGVILLKLIIVLELTVNHKY